MAVRDIKEHKDTTVRGPEVEAEAEAGKGREKDGVGMLAPP